MKPSPRKPRLPLASLRSTVGAIDLASIMVGVLVIGIVGGVIAATVFAVIPWSQNEAAKQSLGAVNTAQSVTYAQSSGDGKAKYMTMDELVSEKLIQADPNVKVATNAEQTCFISAAQSDTGLVFYATDKKLTPTVAVPTGCDAVAPVFDGVEAPVVSSDAVAISEIWMSGGTVYVQGDAGAGLDRLKGLVTSTVDYSDVSNVNDLASSLAPGTAVRLTAGDGWESIVVQATDVKVNLNGAAQNLGGGSSFETVFNELGDAQWSTINIDADSFPGGADAAQAWSDAAGLLDESDVTVTANIPGGTANMANRPPSSGEYIIPSDYADDSAERIAGPEMGFTTWNGGYRIEAALPTGEGHSFTEAEYANLPQWDELGVPEIWSAELDGTQNPGDPIYDARVTGGAITDVRLKVDGATLKVLNSGFARMTLFRFGYFEHETPLIHQGSIRLAEIAAIEAGSGVMPTYVDYTLNGVKMRSPLSKVFNV